MAFGWNHFFVPPFRKLKIYGDAYFFRCIIPNNFQLHFHPPRSIKWIFRPARECVVRRPADIRVAWKTGKIAFQQAALLSFIIVSTHVKFSLELLLTPLNINEFLVNMRWKRISMQFAVCLWTWLPFLISMRIFFQQEIYLQY